MTDRRTVAQRVSDSFDRELFNLIDTARVNSCDTRDFTKAQAAAWGEVFRLLSEARPKVRAMMSREDREATS